MFTALCQGQINIRDNLIMPRGHDIEISTLIRRHFFFFFFFHFDISQHHGPTYISYKISAGEMDLNARVDVIFLGSA